MSDLTGIFDKLKWVTGSWHVKDWTTYSDGTVGALKVSDSYSEEECNGVCAEGAIEYVLRAATHDDTLNRLLERWRRDEKSNVDLDSKERLLLLDRYILEAGRRISTDVFKAWVNEPSNKSQRCMTCSLRIKNKQPVVSRLKCEYCSQYYDIALWNDAPDVDEDDVREFFDVLEQFPLWQRLMATSALHDPQRQSIATGFALNPTVAHHMRVIEHSPVNAQDCVKLLVASNVI